MADTGTQSVNPTAFDSVVREEVNKRLTLNWLIQGAAQHAGMTFHHLVRDELDALHPGLLRLYDQYALINILQYWHFDAAMLLGFPSRFWKQASSKPSHPFFAHPLLSKHGGALAADAKRRAVDRAKEKGVTCTPILFAFQAAYLTVRLQVVEARHSSVLINLAKKATATVWGISMDRLNAALTRNVVFGDLSTPRTLRGRFLRGAAVAYGGVMRCSNGLRVVAKAPNWQLLTKELVKGTAELICLHGLNGLPEDAYRQVIHDADQIEFEPWMLQSGGELWRHLLAVLPPHLPLAEVLMHLARLPAQSLQSLLLAVIEKPQHAREVLVHW